LTDQQESRVVEIPPARKPDFGDPPAPAAVQPLLVAAVAVGYVALAVPDGGFSTQLIAGVAVALWWAVILGLALGIVPRDSVPGAALVAGASLAGLGLMTALSLGWASDSGRAFVEAVRVVSYLGLFVAVVLASRRGAARSWLLGLAIGLVAVAALALGSRLEPFLPGGNAELAKFLPGAQGRLSYPIGYWNALAATLAVALSLLTWLGAQAYSRAGRAVAVASLPLVALALYLTSSRGGAAAAAAGIVAVVAFGPARPRLLGGLALGAAGAAPLILFASQQHNLVDGLATHQAASQGDQVLAALIGVVAVVGALRYLADDALGRLVVPRPVARGALIALAVVAVVGLIAADPAQRWDDFKDPGLARSSGESTAGSRFVAGTGSGRYQFWGTALDAFSAHPLHGIGAGQYETWWNQHGTIPRQVKDAHSLFFEMLGELGLPGLVLVLGFLGSGVVVAVRRRRTPGPGGEVGAAFGVLVAVTLAAAVDWMWEIPATFGPAVLAVALLTGPAIVPARSRLAARQEDRYPAPSRYGWGVATLLVGWAALWAAGVLFFTSVKLDASRAAVDRGDLAQAAQDAVDARTLEPWSSEPSLQLALVDELGGDLPAARTALDEAIARAPEDWRLQLVSARLYVESNDLARARQALAKARALNPREPILQRAPREVGGGQ
jgi:hypothetical protein